MANLSAGALHGRVASATKYFLPQLVEYTRHQNRIRSSLGTWLFTPSSSSSSSPRLCLATVPKKNPLPGVNLVTDDANDGK
jgi:hypothetical protein